MNNMTTDLDREILLREWEQRYETYRAYLRQYLYGMGIVLTAYVIGLTLSFSLKIDPTPQLALLGAMLFAVFTLLVIHWRSIQAIDQLGKRIKILEAKLGMDDFDTGMLAQQVIRLGTIVVIFGCLFTIGLIVFVIVG